MKNVYKNKVKINKKRKPLYPDEYKMKEINEKKKLKKMMDNYFNDYNKISKKLKITESPYILVSEKDYEDAVYNTDLMIRKWNDFYDMTPTYNPQVEDNYYNDSSVIFENTKNPLIKKDYKKRIEKFYQPSEQEFSNTYNQTFKSGKQSNMNFYNSISVKNEEKKEIENEDEEEYKFDENDKKIDEEEEYKFDESDKNFDEKKNEDNIEEEYKFDENDVIEESINNGNKLKDVNKNKEDEFFYEEKEEIDKKDGPKLNKNQEKEFFYEEKEEIDKKNGPKLNSNKFNNYEENIDFEIEENIVGKKKSNKKIKDDTEKLPLLNDIIKDDTEKLPLLNDIIKDDSKNISKNSTFKNKTKVEKKLKDNENMLNYMENEEIDDKKIEEDLPKIKGEKKKLLKSISLNKERNKENSNIKKSNTLSLNKLIEIKKTNTVKKENDSSISEIKKSYTTKLNNKLKNRLSITRENKLKKKKRKENTLNPNDTIYDMMKNIDNNSKIITTAFNRNLIINLNKRQKINSGWDSKNRYLIFIYIEKLFNNKRDVESLLIRYYSLRQKRTHYKIVSIRLLYHMGVFPSNIIDRIKIKGYSNEIMKAVEKIIIKENKK